MKTPDNLRRICSACWRKLVNAGPDEKSPNFTSTMRTRIYAEFWCQACGEPADGYVEMPCPKGSLLAIQERRR